VVKQTEVVRSTEISLNFAQNIRRHVYKNNIAHSYRHENLKSHKFSLLSIREKNNQFSEHNPST
jgi:hypothetical protein